MILTDFETGGFPVTQRSPIVCTVIPTGKKSIQMVEVKLVYNRYDLKEVVKKYKIINLMGIYPGRKNTDGYKLDISVYSDMPAPPEKHKLIDNAIDIQIVMNHDQFSKVSYKLPDNEHVIVDRDLKLYDFVTSSGLKYKKTFE